jgi:hypothetical protein
LVPLLISREVKALVFPFSLLLFTLVDTPQNPELIKNDVIPFALVFQLSKYSPLCA